METQSQTEELTSFFKALSEVNRLKIIGCLAQRPYTVEELAETLGIGVSTTSHHLSRLSKAGLVSARAEGHYYSYSLETAHLKKMARQLLKEDTLPRLSGQAFPGDRAARKVLDAFTDPQGRITAIPVQEKKFRLLLEYVVRDFQPGVAYTEKEVNEILTRFNEDTALLRRGLVDHHLMDRKPDGKAYWRVEAPAAA